MQPITYRQPEMKPITIYESDTVAHGWTVLVMLEKIEAFLKDKKKKLALSNKQFFFLISTYDHMLAYKNYDRQQEEFLTSILKESNYG